LILNRFCLLNVRKLWEWMEKSHEG
jgi:hypothetical protein